MTLRGNMYFFKKEKLIDKLVDKRPKSIGILRFKNPKPSLITIYNHQKQDSSKFFNPFKRLRLLLGQEHQEMVREFSPESDLDKRIRVTDRLYDNLILTTSSLGLAMVNALFLPSLFWVSLFSTLFVSKDVFVGTYDAVVRKKSFNVDIRDAVVTVLLLAMNRLLLCNVILVYSALRRRFVEAVRHSTSDAFVEVFRQQPRMIWVLVNDVEMEIPIEQLSQDDIVCVGAGNTIPIDGVVIRGVASIDQHILTGESQPVDRGIGDSVYALTTVLSGKIYLQVTHTGSETVAAQIGHILNHTVDGKTDMQLQAEAWSDHMVPIGFMLSAITLPFNPLGAASILFVLPQNRAIISSSLAILTYLNQTCEQGVLIKDGRTLELMGQVDTIVFDKTGTLTLDKLQVKHIHTFSDLSIEQILSFAAAAEQRQSHPIALAILQAASTHQAVLPSVDNLDYKLGYGLTAQISEKTIQVGSRRLLEEHGIPISAQSTEISNRCHQQGNTFIFVAIDGKVCGGLELSPIVRPEAQEIINILHEKFAYSFAIISGDHKLPTQQLAHSLGIDMFFAETLPEQKADLISELQSEGKTVCYVGDGINDAIAMKKADVSISLRGASTVASDTADVVLMDSNLRKLPYIFEVAQKFEKDMNVNLSLNFGSTWVAIIATMVGGLGFVPGVIIAQLPFLASIVYGVSPLLKTPDQKNELPGGMH